MTEATTEREYTGMQLVNVLAACGQPLGYSTVLQDILPMLRELGLVRVEDVSKPGAPGRTIRNMTPESTVRLLVAYLKARQEQNMGRYPHGVQTWRMLVNLGYMRE